MAASILYPKKDENMILFQIFFRKKMEKLMFWSIYPGNFGSYRSRIVGNDRLVHLRAGIRVSDQRKVSVRHIFKSLEGDIFFFGASFLFWSFRAQAFFPASWTHLDRSGVP